MGERTRRRTIKVELEGTSDTFVSYLVTAQTDLPGYASQHVSIRRRFHDFVFLRRALSHDFTACVVPPLPDKHRMEYVIGDRFSPEFIERRRQDLERFLQRVARHPKLSRTEVFQAFLESTEWNVFKHRHHARSSSHDDSHAGVLDSLSDTLLNAFSKLKKPDERFVVIRAHLDSFEEGLASLERLAARSKTRMGDLSGDYEDLAVSVQGLGYLESGITDPLMRFERALVDFGGNVKDHSAAATEGFLEHVHSLLGYSHAFKGVLKLRDQKQLDFEELSAYLSNVVVERDRLANGYGYGMGLGSYFKEKVESLRGGETDMSRAARLHRLDAKIKELQEAVLHAQETSNAFNDQVLLEHEIFRATKRHEMKVLLGAFAEGQIRMHKQSVAAWDRTMPPLERIYVEN
ncbi:intercellular trafficking and secretion [Rhodotorula sphaerocarpa]